ncbi:hypothetical protein BCR44DRAFT_52656 [Catenaria anguillulae PL171]|uniref:NADH dehydrogenase [ubiquinone] 1 beta subcomplex subunit 4 n=1 Tax=Catenaria anguillulae PL171 TaxID=765915 RepID=A0A1Y2HAA1_9FUNG|nr:hypothetical protein BCR44DRAFT_52656 [Catenaria anguillulae PL171]
MAHLHILRMAAHLFPAVKTDPAIEAWAHMRENTEHQFRLTPRTLRIGAVLLLATPFVLYKVSVAGDNYLKKQQVFKAKPAEE